MSGGGLCVRGYVFGKSYTAWSLGVWLRVSEMAEFEWCRVEARNKVRDLAALLIAGGYSE